MQIRHRHRFPTRVSQDKIRGSLDVGQFVLFRRCSETGMSWYYEQRNQVLGNRIMNGSFAWRRSSIHSSCRLLAEIAVWNFRRSDFFSLFIFLVFMLGLGVKNENENERSNALDERPDGEIARAIPCTTSVCSGTFPKEQNASKDFPEKNLVLV